MKWESLMEAFTTKMASKHWSQSTVKNYGGQVRLFLQKFPAYNRPKDIPASEIERYLLTIANINTRNHARCGIQAFYLLVVGQPMKLSQIPWPKKEHRLPKVISQNSLVSKITAIENKKHKALLALAYCCGLRVSEICNLTVSDFNKGMLFIRQSKGRKDRFVAYTDTVAGWLRDYHLEYNPTYYLFTGQFGEQYSTRSCQQIFKKYIDRGKSFHCMRHSCATTMLEQGTDLTIIQKILGHANIKTTQIYTYISNALIQAIPKPI